MNDLKKLWPFSFKSKDVTSLVISIVIYIVVGAVLGVLMGVLGAIPVVSIITWIVGTVVDIYCLVGIILAILSFAKVIK